LDAGFAQSAVLSHEEEFFGIVQHFYFVARVFSQLLGLVL
jgi:hypothetical protein